MSCKYYKNGMCVPIDNSCRAYKGKTACKALLAYEEGKKRTFRVTISLNMSLRSSWLKDVHVYEFVKSLNGKIWTTLYEFEDEFLLKHFGNVDFDITTCNFYASYLGIASETDVLIGSLTIEPTNETDEIGNEKWERYIWWCYSIFKYGSITKGYIWNGVGYTISCWSPDSIKTIKRILRWFTTGIEGERLIPLGVKSIRDCDDWLSQTNVIRPSLSSLSDKKNVAVLRKTPLLQAWKRIFDRMKGDTRKPLGGLKHNFMSSEFGWSDEIPMDYIHLDELGRNVNTVSYEPTRGTGIILCSTGKSFGAVSLNFANFLVTDADNVKCLYFNYVKNLMVILNRTGIKKKQNLITIQEMRKEFISNLNDIHELSLEFQYLNEISMLVLRYNKDNKVYYFPVMLVDGTFKVKPIMNELVAKLVAGILTADPYGMSFFFPSMYQTAKGYCVHICDMEFVPHVASNVFENTIIKT